MKNLLITHVDLDGCGAPILINIFQDKIHFDDIWCEDYDFEKDEDKWNKMINDYDEIIFSDISIPKESADKLREKNIHIEFYDHHIAAEWIKDDENSKYSEDMCGSKLFYEYYVKPRVSRIPLLVDHFIDLIDTYDCWREGFPLWEEAKDLNSVLYGIQSYNTNLTAYQRMKPFFDKMVNKILTRDTWKWSLMEFDIIQKSRKREKEVHDEALVNMKIRKDNKGLTYGIILAPSKISLVCSTILAEKPELDYLICINSFRGISGKLSFRTKRKDLDLNTISACAGHEQAAGAQITSELAIKFYNNSKLSFIYKADEGFDKDDEKTWLKETL